MKQTAARMGEIIITLVLTLVALAILQQSSTMSEFGESVNSPGLFPALAAIVMLLSLAVNWRQVGCNLPPVSPSEEGSNAGKKELLVSMVMVLAYVLLIPVLRFNAATALYLWGAFLFFRAASWRKSLVISLSTVLFVMVVFRIIFRIVLP